MFNQILLTAEVETRKVSLLLEERVSLPSDRPVEGAVRAALDRLLVRSFDQGFLRQGDMVDVKLRIRRL